MCLYTVELSKISRDVVPLWKFEEIFLCRLWPARNGIIFTEVVSIGGSTVFGYKDIAVGNLVQV